ncbi:MAG: zf-HC2 domain-containing protein [Actinomycetota bacterium]
MRCEEIALYLPGYRGRDLHEATARVVEDHLADCEDCTAAAARFERVHVGLTSLVGRNAEPPAHLLDSILEAVHESGARKFFLPPIPALADLARTVLDNRDAVVSAAGTALVAAGAAYAMWRALRGSRRIEPAT